MNWYLVKLIYCVDISGNDKLSQFDEQLKLIKALNLEEAFFKARELGKKGEAVFTNTNKLAVNWKFIDVADLKLIEHFEDGMEVYSRTEEVDDPLAFIQFVRQKAMVIQSEMLMYI